MPIRPLSHPSRNVQTISTAVHLRPASCAVVARPRGSGPARREPVNRVRSGRKQLSAETPGCRRVAWSSCGRASTPHEESVGAPVQSGRGQPVPEVPTATLRRVGRPGPRHHRVAQRGHRGSRRSRVPLLRAARHRQDDDGALVGAGAELPRSRRRRRAVRQVRELRRDRRRRVLRPRRARRGVEQRRRGDARPHPERAPRARAELAAQGVHHRRGPHALGRGVEHAAEDARGAARRTSCSCSRPPTRTRCCRPSARARSTSSSRCCRPRSSPATWSTSSAARASRPTPRSSISSCAGPPARPGTPSRCWIRRSPSAAERSTRPRSRPRWVGRPSICGWRCSKRSPAEDVAGALVGVHELLTQGHDVRRVADDLLRTLRDAFMAANADGRVPYDGPGRRGDQARRARAGDGQRVRRARDRDPRAGDRRHPPADGRRPAPGARSRRRAHHAPRSAHERRDVVRTRRTTGTPARRRRWPRTVGAVDADRACRTRGAAASGRRRPRRDARGPVLRRVRARAEGRSTPTPPPEAPPVDDAPPVGRSVAVRDRRRPRRSTPTT